MENHSMTFPNEKPCSICGVTKPLDQFENDKRRPDGHGPRCKPCIKERQATLKQKKQEAASKWVKKELKSAKTVPKPKEQKSRLRGNQPGFDKFGVDMRESAMCVCSKPGEPHYDHRHVEVANPDGAGNIRVCWAGGCDCKNFVSKTGGVAK